MRFIGGKGRVPDYLECVSLRWQPVVSVELRLVRDGSFRPPNNNGSNGLTGNDSFQTSATVRQMSATLVVPWALRSHRIGSD